VNIPIHFETDCEAIRNAIASLASENPERLRIMRITDTLNLDRLLVSESCIETLRYDQNVTIVGEPMPMQCDGGGNLLPF
jgi:hypothetical protein